MNLALNLSEKQLQKLDQYIMQINGDTTLRQKCETINLMLANQAAPAPPCPSSSSSSSFQASNYTINNNNKSASNSSSVANMSDLDNAPSSHLTNMISGFHLAGPTTIRSSVQPTTQQQQQAQQQQELDFDKIEMLLIDLRKYIATSTIYWNTRVSNFFKKSKFFDDVRLFILFIS